MGVQLDLEPMGNRVKIGRGLSITDHLHRHKITTKTDIFVTQLKYKNSKIAKMLKLFFTGKLYFSILPHSFLHLESVDPCPKTELETVDP